MSLQPIPNILIENALNLTNTPMNYMIEWVAWEFEVEWKFSIEKFCYYLLSQTFLATYCEEVEVYSKINDTDSYLAWRKTGTKLVKYGATQTWRQEYDVTNIKL